MGFLMIYNYRINNYGITIGYICIYIIPTKSYKHGEIQPRKNRGTTPPKYRFLWDGTLWFFTMNSHSEINPIRMVVEPWSTLGLILIQPLKHGFCCLSLCVKLVYPQGA